MGHQTLRITPARARRRGTLSGGGKESVRRPRPGTGPGADEAAAADQAQAQVHRAVPSPPGTWSRPPVGAETGAPGTGGRAVARPASNSPTAAAQTTAGA
ncbi:hypothetical protein [Streptomyces atroolivaceus]|uniref:hypothetical protein n=1 Tax=Streptomyces atroolivaceus TaxID=66869 RepID=UPI002023FED6|nr:hypothetical protein [Streptomyces atroolivaceus]